jgi:glyoxylase-like metal-dependent hydrolase (beta-lactamase superfamily II)
MLRRNFIRSSAFSLGALSLSYKSLLQSSFDDPWKIKMLSDDFGIFTEKGGTILFYFSKEGIVVVDAQFPEQSKHLIDELKKRNDKPYRLLVNTHHHMDHTSGNISFKGLTNKVLAHENSKKNQEQVAINQKTEDQQLYPNQTFDSVWSEDIGKEKLTLHYFGPAHTNGDALIHFEHADILHMGDLINNRRYPYIDQTAGASIKGWIEVLEKTIKKFSHKTTFVFGHASEGFEVYGKKDDLKAMKDYFEKLVVFTEKEIKAGKSEEEFLKNTSIPGVTEWIGTGIERSLTAAYLEFSR